MNDTIIKVAKIAYSTSVDGVGLRNALYVSGCNRRCPGCHNPQLWDINAGQDMTIQEAFDKLNIDDFNISILGGEPMMQYEQVVELCKLIKEKTNKTIWLWSGYELHEIKSQFPKILKYIDVLVDGPFIEEFKEPNLKWRGSSNQNIIPKEYFWVYG
jgi:anaerobic ribonucleoside-triphosphate reductase activating protein